MASTDVSKDVQGEHREGGHSFSSSNNSHAAERTAQQANTGTGLEIYGHQAQQPLLQDSEEPAGGGGAGVMGFGNPPRQHYEPQRQLTDTSNQHPSVRAPRPAFLPGAGGVDVAVPQDRNPYLLPGSEASGMLPIIAAPILVRIDGGDPDSSLSGGLDSAGRLVPLDRTKFALFHIPSAIYPHPTVTVNDATSRAYETDETQSHRLLSNPNLDAQTSGRAAEYFVPLSMPAFAQAQDQHSGMSLRSEPCAEDEQAHPHEKE